MGFRSVEGDCNEAANIVFASRGPTLQCRHLRLRVPNWLRVNSRAGRLYAASYRLPEPRIFLRREKLLRWWKGMPCCGVTRAIVMPLPRVFTIRAVYGPSGTKMAARIDACRQSPVAVAPAVPGI